MASGNMIVTLVANTRKWSSGLNRAGRDTMTFGKLVSSSLRAGAFALIGFVAAISRVIPGLLAMGAESRKADVQLRFLLENMNGISKATDETTKRMSAYADSINRATGIDDEQIKLVQKKLLVFKNVRASADETAGAFDRATAAAVDLAAGGFGTLETNAKLLGRMLESPATNLERLTRAGITFTDSEKQKIIALQESGKLFAAQDMVLKSIEGRVQGLAEKSATPLDKLNGLFAQLGDEIGERMLPFLDKAVGKLTDFLATAAGQRTIERIIQAFEELAKSIGFVVDALIYLATWWDKATEGARKYQEQVAAGKGRFGRESTPMPGNTGNSGNPSAPGGTRMADKAIVINFNAPVDSVSAGREVARVLADYNRSNGRR
jgi:ABC-type amino acid transport substrate-binding protein